MKQLSIFRREKPRVKQVEVVSFTREDLQDQMRDNDVRVPYEPLSEGMLLGTLIPRSMSSRIDQIKNLISKRVGNVDDFLVSELGYRDRQDLYSCLSAEQIDSVALGICQIKAGKSLIVADQTGTGKGRQAAGLIRWCVLHKITPIFFTLKSSLFSDMHRDLMDIGSPDYRYFIMNPDKAGKITEGIEVVQETSDNQRKHVLSKSVLPDVYDVVMTTYSQFRMKGKNNKKRLIEGLASKSVLIMDEAHAAAGDSNTGEFMSDIVSDSKGACYFSATWAKRADNLPIFALKTDIQMVNIDRKSLIKTLKAGGNPLAEQLAIGLAQQGQLIRREQSFRNVETEYVLLDDPIYRKKMDIITEIFREMVCFEHYYIKPVMDMLRSTHLEEGNKFSFTPLSSRLHLLVNQILFALKAPAIAEDAINQIKNEKKVVVAFQSTMEAFIADYEGAGTLQKDDISLCLLRITTKMFDYVLHDFSEINQETGKPTIKREAIQIRSENGKNWFQEIVEKCTALVTGISASPIDVMTRAFAAAGVTYREVTGRERKIEARGSHFKIIKFKKGDHKKSFFDFNNGEADILLLNASGGTGTSCHSSVKFKDQKPRVMILAQLNPNTQEEMQIRGRVNRAGQVNWPTYRYINTNIPAELRLMMSMKMKMKSLDSLTTANQYSGDERLECIDMIDPYGNIAAKEMLLEDTDLNIKIGDPLKLLKKKKSKREEVTDAASKVTGRVAMLSCTGQEEFYYQFEDRYKAVKDFHETAGQSLIDSKIIDIQAQFKGGKKLIDGLGKGPFGRPTYLYEASCLILKKPLNKKAIDDRIAKFASSPRGHKNETIELIKKSYETRINQHKESASLRIKEKIAQMELSGKSDGEITKAKRSHRIATEKSVLGYGTEEIELTNLLGHFIPGYAYFVPHGENDSSRVAAIFIRFSHPDKDVLYPSALKLEFAVADGRRIVSITASKSKYLNKIVKVSEYMTPYKRGSLQNRWISVQEMQEARESRYIVVGNLFQAMQYPQLRGEIVSFSDIKGEWRDGIMLSRAFNPDRLKISPSYINKSVNSKPKPISDFLFGELPDEKVVSTACGSFSLFKKGDAFHISVDKNKKIGSFVFSEIPSKKAAYPGWKKGRQEGHTIEFHEMNWISVRNVLSEIDLKILV